MSRCRRPSFSHPSSPSGPYPRHRAQRDGEGVPAAPRLEWVRKVVQGQHHLRDERHREHRSDAQVREREERLEAGLVVREQLQTPHCL